MDTYRINLLRLLLGCCSFHVTTAAEYCSIFCQNGCCDDGCCANTESLGVGFAVGCAILLCLIIVSVIVYLGYRRKRLKKDKLKDTKKHLITLDRPNVHRDIHVDTANCSITIIQRKNTKIRISVNNEKIKIISTDDVEVKSVQNLNQPRQPAGIPANIRQQLAAGLNRINAVS